MSSTKTPWPWTRRRSSLRGTLWPFQVSSAVSVRSGATVVELIRGRLDRLEDVPVAGAAADVALQSLLDLGVGRMRVLAQQRGRAHQHAGRAVAALERVVVRECLLELRQLLAVGEPFDRLDARAVGLDGEQHAALDERAVDDHGARAAVARVAADVAAGQVEVVADEMDQQLARFHLALVRRAVDGDRDRAGRRDRACFQLASAPRVVRGLGDRAHGEHRGEMPAVVGRGVHVGGGFEIGAGDSPRTASASAEAGSSTTGTASTQPSATLTLPFTDAAALTMQVPSTPSVTAAKPSARPAGTLIARQQLARRRRRSGRRRGRTRRAKQCARRPRRRS